MSNYLEMNCGQSDWKHAALPVARKIVRRKRKPFLAESILKDVVAQVGLPKDGRSFGAVVKSLAADGDIRAIGYAPAKTSHGSAKTLWERVQ